MNNIRDNSVTIPEYKNRKRKTLEELTIKDDFMFSKVFSGDLRLAKRLVELAMGRKVKDIRYHEPQASVDEFYNSKGIRLDVLLDGDTEWINVEMQNQDLKDIFKRIRYYSSLLTVQSLKPGEKYKDLKNGVNIVITSYDPFGLGYEKYICKENAYGENEKGEATDITKESNYDGGYVKIYLNIGPQELKHRAKNKELRAVLDYFRTNKPTNSFTSQIEDKVELTKMDVNARIEFMTLEDKLEIEREQSKEEGRKEGIAEGKSIGLAEGKSIGLEEGKIEVAKNLLQMGTLSVENISSATSLSVEEVQELAKAIQ